MIPPDALPVARVRWPGARRIIRSLYPAADLFDDLAEPEDWPLLHAAESKTNPRLMEDVGALAAVPADRRPSGPGASLLLAPFAHASPDRPSRFSAGAWGVLYAARAFDTALAETMHHHGRFMAATREAPGWTSQFRELVLDVAADLHDLRGAADAGPALDPDRYAPAQALAAALRAAGSDGLAYPSVRHAGGECAALFYPDGATGVRQARHLDYHWNGRRVDLYREAGAGGAVYRVA